MSNDCESIETQLFDYDESEVNFEAWAHEHGYSLMKDEAGVTTYQKVIDGE